MNTLPIQLTSSANATADSTKKSFAAESGNSETSFRDVLKSEVAERRQAEAGAPHATSQSEKTSPKSKAGTTSESAEAGRDNGEEESAIAANQEDMAQFLVLTSQFVQPVTNPDATATVATDAAAGIVDAALKNTDMTIADAGVLDATAKNASMTDSVAGMVDAAVRNAGMTGAAAGTVDEAVADPNVATHAKRSVELAGLPPTTSERASVAPARIQHGTEAPTGSKAPAEKTDFNAELNQARLSQLPASVSPDKAAQQAGAASEVLVSNVQATEAAHDTQQTQAASFVALQQAGIEQPERPSDPAANRIAPRVATPAWNQAVGQKIVWMAGNEQQSASLSLNPPDLGPLQVVIRVSESTATANFVSAHPEVRQALEAAMPRLREMLGEAGIQLGQAHVGAGTSGEYGARAQQLFSPPAGGSVEPSYSLQQDVQQPVQTIRRGLVDTFA